jgi:hypothetical protein
LRNNRCIIRSLYWRILRLSQLTFLDYWGIHSFCKFPLNIDNSQLEELKIIYFKWIDNDNFLFLVQNIFLLLYDLHENARFYSLQRIIILVNISERKVECLLFSNCSLHFNVCIAIILVQQNTLRSIESLWDRKSYLIKWENRICNLWLRWERFNLKNLK